jgi:hypothetical protein
VIVCRPLGSGAWMRSITTFVSFVDMTHPPK